MRDFFKKLAEHLGVEPADVQQGSVLEDFDEWDSLGTLTIVSMIADDYGVTVHSEELARTQTAGKLWDLVQQKSAGEAS